MHLVAVWAVDLSVLATVDLCAVQGPAADQAAEAASAEERDTLLSLYHGIMGRRFLDGGLLRYRK